MTDEVLVPTTGIPAPQFRVELRQFLDSKQRRVLQHDVVQGTLPPGYCRFTGAGMAKSADGEIRPHNFDLPGATDIETAYGLYDTLFAAVLQRDGLEGIPTPDVPFFVVELKQYMDSTQQRIVERVPVINTPPDGWVKFTGAGTLVLPPYQLPSGKTIPGGSFVEEFDLPGCNTLDEAYTAYGPTFDEVGRKTGEQYRNTVIKCIKEELKAKEDAEKAELKKHKKGLILPGPGYEKRK